MRQRVTYGGNFNTDGEGKFTKFYNEEGSYEVIKDNITGKEKYLIYIGGTPYESNIIYLKDLEYHVNMKPAPQLKQLPLPSTFLATVRNWGFGSGL